MKKTNDHDIENVEEPGTQSITDEAIQSSDIEESEKQETKGERAIKTVLEALAIVLDSCLYMAAIYILFCFRTALTSFSTIFLDFLSFMAIGGVIRQYSLYLRRNIKKEWLGTVIFWAVAILLAIIFVVFGYYEMSFVGWRNMSIF